MFPIVLYRWLWSLFLRRMLDEIVLTPRGYVSGILRSDCVFRLHCCRRFGHQLVQAWLVLLVWLVWLVMALGRGPANSVCRSAYLTTHAAFTATVCKWWEPGLTAIACTWWNPTLWGPADPIPMNLCYLSLWPIPMYLVLLWYLNL